MIIDTHLHFGKIDKFDMPQEVLIQSLNKYHIDYGIVSNIEGCEFGCDLNFIDKKYQLSQLEVNKKTLDFVKQYPHKLRGQFWIKPYTASFDDQVKMFMLQNKDYFVGFKVHPYHSNMRITDKRCEKYLEFANEYHLSVAVHTAQDDNSHPYHVYCVAKKYPNINFIMVHMGLGTDNEEAILYISKLDNLYGDTTWVSPKKVLKAIQICGKHKILFGTDSPISGFDTYQKYEELLKQETKNLTKEQIECLLFLNAKSVFRI